MAREKIGLGLSPHELIGKMSEGNPGAIATMTQLADMKLVRALDDMNMRGCQIWAAYKDFAGQDIDKLKSAIKIRDPAMIKKVNQVCIYGSFVEEASLGSLLN